MEGGQQPRRGRCCLVLPCGQHSCSLVPLPLALRSVLCEATQLTPGSRTQPRVLRKSLEMPHDKTPEQLTSAARFSFLSGPCSRITSCHHAVRSAQQSRRPASDELTSSPALPPAVLTSVAQTTAHVGTFFFLSLRVGPGAVT